MKLSRRAYWFWQQHRWTITMVVVTPVLLACSLVLSVLFIKWAVAL